MSAPEFLSGVIEGFYGQPWSQAERFELFDRMAAWGLNTYLYAPKDDLKHRAFWRDPYSDTEAAALGELIRACRSRGLRFLYALSPGLDIRYSDDAELDRLKHRFQQMLALGCESFALLFDDIPVRMEAEDAKRWDSFAAAQCHAANVIFAWVRERAPHGRFLFCPTPYCGRMAERGLGGPGYLDVLGAGLHPEIDIFWTGPEIISREITTEHVRELRARLRRKPLIWDNLHANDYDGRRFFCGPYAGRPVELRQETSGILSNPNCEFPLNYVPLRTLAAWVRSEGAWNPREAWINAMREWLPSFRSAGRPIELDDLLLFGDCYYLPHEEGPLAEALIQCVQKLLTTAPAQWGDQAAAFREQAARIKEFCARATELRNRPLFYALSRRIWELREEFDLLERCIEFKLQGAPPDAECVSDFHLLGTYRGGTVARLQRLFPQQAGGGFLPAPQA